MLYRYVCPKCGNETLLLRKVEESDKQVKCDICGTTMKRKISNIAAISYKGKGYYATDYAVAEKDSDDNG